MHALEHYAVCVACIWAGKGWNMNGKKRPGAAPQRFLRLFLKYSVIYYIFLCVCVSLCFFDRRPRPQIWSHAWMLLLWAAPLPASSAGSSDSGSSNHVCLLCHHVSDKCLYMLLLLAASLGKMWTWMFLAGRLQSCTACPWLVKKHQISVSGRLPHNLSMWSFNLWWMV